MKFHVAAMLLLFLELFSPFAYATPTPAAAIATPAAPTFTPTASPAATALPSPPKPTRSGLPACGVQGMSDADRQKLWDNTIGFQGNEFNSLPLADALAAKKEEDPFNKPYKPVEQDERTVSVYDLANELGVTPKEVAEPLGIKIAKDGTPETVDVPESDAQKVAVHLAERQAKTGSPSSQLLESLLGSVKKVYKIKGTKMSKPELRNFEKYKIRLPGDGKEISIARFAQLNKIDLDACVLPENFQGSVSYYALLDEDVLYATKASQNVLEGKVVYPPTGKTEELGKVNQHFMSRSGSTTGLLTLNGGSNLIIPSFFEEWVTYVGDITFYDFYLSTLLGLGVWWSASKMDKELIKKNEDLKRFAGMNARTLQTSDLLGRVAESDLTVKTLLQNNPAFRIPVGGVPPQQRAVVEELIAKVRNNKLTFAEDKMVKDYATRKIAPQAMIDEANALRPAIDKLARGETLDAADLAKLQTSAGINTAGLPSLSVPPEASTSFGQYASAVKESHISDVKRFDEELIKNQIKELTERKELYDSTWKALGSRVSYSMFLGGVWQGPVRLAFSKNSLLLFNMNQNKEQFVRVQANKPQTAKKFREATDIYGIGTVQEMIGSYTGGVTTPGEAFSVGKMALINKPGKRVEITEDKSTTILSRETKTIATAWNGVSDATNFEDIKDLGKDQKFARMPLIAYNTFPDVGLDRQQEAKFLGYVAKFALSFIIYRDLSSAGADAFALPIPLYLNTQLMRQNLNEFDGQECKASVLNEYKLKYGAATAGGLFLNFLPLIKQWNAFETVLAKGLLASTTKGKLLSLETVLNVVNMANIAEAYKIYLSGQAMQYTSACVDLQHRILAFQEVPNTFKKKPTAQNQIDDLLEKIKAPSVIEDTFKAPEPSQLKEIINFKATMHDQDAAVTPEGIYWLQVEKSMFSTNFALFKQLDGRGCNVPQNLVGADGSIHRFDNNKYSIYNKDGSLRAQFDDEGWRFRVAARFTAQQLAKLILPNKFIDSQLDGSGNVFADVSSDGTIMHVDATSCDLPAALEQVTGKQVGDELSKAVGKAVSIKTNEGIGMVKDGEIRFIRDSGAKPGNEQVYPNADDRKKLTSSVLKGFKLQVLGNGQVILKAPAGSASKEESLGTLETIIGADGKGRIDYDAASGRMIIFVYSLYNGHASQLAGVTASIAENGKGIKLQAKAKPGQEEAVKELNAALDKIQEKDGVKILENADHAYYITPDGKLRVVDKKTGKATDYNITGPLTRDGNSVIIPTDKGPFKFSFDTNNGRLNMGVEGPNGLKELLPLLKAAGPQGILTFNPTTGGVNVYNGQDIPLSPDFAKNGISYNQGEQGPRAYPGQNPFLLSTTPSTGSQNGGKINLPSWPENTAMMITMLLAIAASVLFIRKRFDR